MYIKLLDRHQILETSGKHLPVNYIGRFKRNQ